MGYSIYIEFPVYPFVYTDGYSSYIFSFKQPARVRLDLKQLTLCCISVNIVHVWPKFRFKFVYRISIAFLTTKNKSTYKAISFALASLSIYYNNGFLDLPELLEELPQLLVGGVVWQAPHEQLGPRGVFALAVGHPRVGGGAEHGVGDHDAGAHLTRGDGNGGLGWHHHFEKRWIRSLRSKKNIERFQFTKTN